MGKTAHEAVANGDMVQAADLGVRRRKGRASSAVADYLRSQLRVPNVYIDPSGAGLVKIDVLAADAAGSGDIHVVQVKLLPAPLTQAAMKTYIDQIKKIPGHYKYLALNKNLTSLAIGTQLFSGDGIGRVGLLLVSESGHGFPNVTTAIKPERFRMNGNELAQVERFLSSAKPDMYVRV